MSVKDKIKGGEKHDKRTMDGACPQGQGDEDHCVRAWRARRAFEQVRFPRDRRQAGERGEGRGREKARVKRAGGEQIGESGSHAGSEIGGLRGCCSKR